MNHHKIANNKLDFQTAKIPPQATDVEEIILGQILLEQHCISEAMPILFAELFYKEEHQKIFTAIKNLYSSNNPVNIITVIQKLKDSAELDFCGGAFYISGLTNRVSSSAGVDYHIRIITQQYLKRQQIKIGMETINDGYDETKDVFETQNELENKVSNLNKHIIGHDFESDLSEEIEKTYNFIVTPRKTRLTGIPTGSPMLNEITGGWQAGDMIIICARPSHGKTSRLLQYLIHAAVEGFKVAFFSIEMNKQKIHTKMINHISEINAEILKNQTWDNSQLISIEAVKNRIKTLPIYINAKSAITPNYIRTVVWERKRKYGLDLIAIDYLQLMMPNEVFRGQQEENKIGSISLALKNLAKDMNVPTIAISQLSRECENRQNKRPIPSDLRYSGQIEQDADMILSQYIPSKYYRKDSDPDYKSEVMSDWDYSRISETGILKNRMGETNLGIKEYFYGELSRYYYETKPEPNKSNENNPF